MNTMLTISNNDPAIKWAANKQCPDGLAKLVLLGLAHHADDDLSFVSRRKLAKWAGVSVDTVAARLNDLEAANLIARFDRHSADGSQLSSKTVLNMPK